MLRAVNLRTVETPQHQTVNARFFILDGNRFDQRKFHAKQDPPLLGAPRNLALVLAGIPGMRPAEYLRDRLGR